MTAKESKYSWLIKRGRKGMAPAHSLPLLRFFLTQWITITPFRKPSWVLFIWGQIHLIPLIEASTATTRGLPVWERTAEYGPFFVYSPGTLLGCDTRSIINDRRKTELTWHLLCQRHPALAGTLTKKSGAASTGSARGPPLPGPGIENQELSHPNAQKNSLGDMGKG